MPSTTRRVPLGLIAALLYMLSLWTPAIALFQKPLIWGPPREEMFFGIQCLLIGWISPPWYANVALAIAAIALAYRRSAVAIACSIAAFVLALSTLAYFGPELRVVHVGYFAWLASIVVVFAAACAGPRRLLEDPRVMIPTAGPDGGCAP